jgi:hypothetical protein
LSARTTIILLAASVLILATACEDEHGLAPPDAPCASCDTCNNLKLPPTGPWYQDGEIVPAVQHTYRGKMSPDGRYLAYLGGNSDYRNDERTYPISGLVVQDVATRRVLHFFLGFYSWFSWHPDAKHLYYVESSILRRLNVQTGENVRYDSLGHWERVAVTSSGRYVYLSGYTQPTSKNGIWQWDPEGNGLRFINGDELFKRNYLVVDDTLLCAVNVGQTIHPTGLYYLNVLTGSVRFIRIPAMNGLFTASSYRGDLSRDSRFVIFNPYVADKKLNDGYADAGIWLLDLESLRLRQVLPKHLHYRFRFRDPQWCTDRTFIADWLCVKDSTVSLYEYSLDGRPLRKLTDRNLRFWE